MIFDDINYKIEVWFQWQFGSRAEEGHIDRMFDLKSDHHFLEIKLSKTHWGRL